MGLENYLPKVKFFMIVLLEAVMLDVGGAMLDVKLEVDLKP